MWKHALHDVLYSIWISQARVLFSSHQSLGNYLEGEAPLVLFDPEYTDRPDSLGATQTLTPVFNTHFLFKVPKGLAPDPAWHTTSAELCLHQPRLLMDRKRHHPAAGHSQ